MACRGRSRLPEVRRGQGERGTGPDRPDFRSRRVRCGISAEGGGARRKHRQLRFCRRKPAAARKYRQSAALADHARAGGGSAPRKLSRKLSRKLFREAIRNYPDPAPRQPNYAAPSNGPISLSAPGVAPQEDDIDLPPEGAPQSRDPRGGVYGAHRPIRRATVTRRLLPRLIRSRPIRHRRQRRPRRGSGPRRAIPSAPSGRSR